MILIECRCFNKSFPRQTGERILSSMTPENLKKPKTLAHRNLLNSITAEGLLCDASVEPFAAAFTLNAATSTALESVIFWISFAQNATVKIVEKVAEFAVFSRKTDPARSRCILEAARDSPSAPQPRNKGMAKKANRASERESKFEKRCPQGTSKFDRKECCLAKWKCFS